MSTKLSDLSEISLGTILTRVKPKSELQSFKQISTISMQELSYICGKDDSSFDEIISKIDIEKVDKCLLTKENDIVIGLSSQMAMVITKERANSLLLSNFCLLIGKIYYQSIRKNRYERRLIELKQLLLNKKLENIL